MKGRARTPIELAVPISISPARKTDQQLGPHRKWIPTALAGVITIATAAFLLLNGLTPFQNKTATASPTIETPVSDTDTPVSLISSPLGPTGVLRFHDGTAILDQAILTALAMPAPPKGSQYEVWLVGAEGERLSLGILELDENGRGTLTFDDSQGQNLLAVYDRVEVTVKPDPDSGPMKSSESHIPILCRKSGLSTFVSYWFRFHWRQSGLLSFRV